MTDAASGPISSPVTIMGIPSPQRFKPGDDLAAALGQALSAAGVTLADGDVVCVASKVVSLVEDRLVPINDDDPVARRALAREHARTVVADSPAALVTRTPQGFVLANGGIDASNVPSGHALLLPADADASATTLRSAIANRYDVNTAVVITDSFGRAWRHGQVDTAIGAAGLSTVRDERGGHDLDGRTLDVTMAATVDAIAAASDLVRSKASATPFVVVRGLADAVSAPHVKPPGVVATVVRPPEQDLFAYGGPTAADEAVRRRRTVREFDRDRPVHDASIDAAVAVAATAPAPHHTQPWRFVKLADETRSSLLDAMADRWRADLKSDGLASEAIARRIARSDDLLRAAPTVIAVFVDLTDAHHYPDVRRQRAERDLFVLSGGAALEGFQVALAARGLGSAWVSATTFCAEVVQAHLDLSSSWVPVGMVAVGWPASPVAPRGSVDPAPLIWSR